MSDIGINQFYKAKLKAKRRNAVWSWGALRDDGTVVLTVWADLREGHEYEIRADSWLPHSHSPGYAERLEHIELIRAGAPCLLVVCHCVDTNTIPREISHFNNRSVFTASGLREAEDGRLMIMATGRIEV